VRVWLSGGRGFVGSNVARAFADGHGAELCAPGSGEVDVTDAAAVTRSVADFRPDAIVHCAILNDFGRLYGDRHAAWDAYVGATRNVVDAANAGGARVLLVSTDWVFDGTQAGATEATPPNPINAYGFLKAASELVVDERAQRGTVARISGVQGIHRARPDTPRAQDAGFGYLVASIVDALSAGRRFTVWESPEINCRATPTLAAHAAELMWRALARDVDGILHCCGGESVTRAELARRTVAAFGLDEELLDFGPPPAGALPGAPVPHDTSLDAAATAAALGVELLDLDAQLSALRAEMETV
jgi:dTDP-4-dehydrorhamnose reductase